MNSASGTSRGSDQRDDDQASDIPNRTVGHCPTSRLPGSTEARKCEEQLYAECLHGTTQTRGPPGTLRAYKVRAAGGTVGERGEKRRGMGSDVPADRGQRNPSPTPARDIDLTCDRHPAFLTSRHALSATRAPLSVDLWKSDVRRDWKPQRGRGSHLWTRTKS